MKPNYSILDKIVNNPNSSELRQSHIIQEKCAELGFDFPNSTPVFSKISEELDEIKEALYNPEKTQADVQDELGDLLFACINLCRHLQVEPEEALIQANQKFVKRFKAVEQILKSTNKTFDNSTDDELNLFWEQAKRELY